jgi:hypothetical protein
MRNIRDYKAKVRPDSESLDSASPFNIVTKAFVLRNFTKEEITQLYQQHTGETGQVFEEDAIALVWKQTQGQSWLVNAIANQVIVEILQSDYKEAAPHLVMMVFLQRVVNGGGQIVREIASGTGRLDLCLTYENRKYPIELKLRHGEKHLEEGLAQTARYMDLHGCNEGWIVVFDHRPTVKWLRSWGFNEKSDGAEGHSGKSFRLSG